MLAFLLCLQVRHRQPRAVELPRQVDRQTAVPVLRVDLLDLAGRPGDAGVVHQAVEPAQHSSASSNSRATCPRSDTSHTVCVNFGSLCFAAASARLVHVADVHLGALAHERTRDLEPDARRARRHQHAQILDAEIHANLPLPAGGERGSLSTAMTACRQPTIPPPAC